MLTTRLIESQVCRAQEAERSINLSGQLALIRRAEGTTARHHEQPTNGYDPRDGGDEASWNANNNNHSRSPTISLQSTASNVTGLLSDADDVSVMAPLVVGL